MSFESKKNLLTPKDQDLYVDWIRKYDLKSGKANGPRIYIAVCKCGSKNLLKAELGIRCMECAAFHTFDSYKRVSEKVRRMALGNIADTRIMQVKEDPKYKDRLRECLIRMGIIKRKIIV